MNSKQITLDIPDWIYKELDKLSRHKVEKYLVDYIKKIAAPSKKASVTNIFDLFSSKEPLSLEHDKYLYG